MITIVIEAENGTRHEAQCVDVSVGQYEDWQAQGLENVSPTEVIMSCTPYESARDIPMSLSGAILQEWAVRIGGDISGKYKVVS